MSAKEKFERIAAGKSTLADEFLDYPLHIVISFMIEELFKKPKREPRVVWLAQRADDSLYEEWFDSSEDSKHFGKPIKFIEVLDDP